MTFTNTPNAPFKTINEACKATGLSKYYLRNGCKAGTIPHIKMGKIYYVDVPKLMENLRSGYADGRQ